MLHKWPGSHKSAAFEMREEESNEVFWMAYPRPFLEYLHKTREVEQKQADEAAEEAADEVPEGASTEKDPDDSTEKSSRSTLLQYLELVREEKVMEGKCKGATRRIYKCNIVPDLDIGTRRGMEVPSSTFLPEP